MVVRKLREHALLGGLCVAGLDGLGEVVQLGARLRD